MWFGLVQQKSTPLHLAAGRNQYGHTFRSGHSESVRLLLAAGSNPNAETTVSSPPSANTMELCGAELCGGLVQGKYTPLHLAAELGHTESVQLLLTAKGNANAENRVSDSLLQI